MQYLGQGGSADGQDHYFRCSKDVILASVKAFARVVNERLQPHYLRSPNATDLEHILQQSKSRGFPGKYGSLDCMHIVWKNCPSSEAGSYLNRKGKKSIILEAVCDSDRRIWHAFVGVPGGSNDLNVLASSPLLDTFRTLPPITYTLNDTVYHTPYLLVDGIYPTLPFLVTASGNSLNPAQAAFTAAHEAERKEVECLFGMLQGRFEFLRREVRLQSKDDICAIVECILTLHNMILEHEDGEYYDDDWDVPFVQQHVRTLCACIVY